MSKVLHRSNTHGMDKIERMNQRYSELLKRHNWDSPFPPPKYTIGVGRGAVPISTNTSISLVKLTGNEMNFLQSLDKNTESAGATTVVLPPQQRKRVSLAALEHIEKMNIRSNEIITDNVEALDVRDEENTTAVDEEAPMVNLSRIRNIMSTGDDELPETWVMRSRKIFAIEGRNKANTTLEEGIIRLKKKVGVDNIWMDMLMLQMEFGPYSGNDVDKLTQPCEALLQTFCYFLKDASRHEIEAPEYKVAQLKDARNVVAKATLACPASHSLWLCRISLGRNQEEMEEIASHAYGTNPHSDVLLVEYLEVASGLDSKSRCELLSVEVLKKPLNFNIAAMYARELKAQGQIKEAQAELLHAAKRYRSSRPLEPIPLELMLSSAAMEEQILISYQDPLSWISTTPPTAESLMRLLTPKSEVYNIDRIQSIISKAFIMHYKEEIQRQHTQNIERKLSGKDGVRTAEHTLPGIKMKVTNSWICTAVSMAKGGYLLIASIMLRELLVSNNSTNHRSDMVIVRPSWIWDFVNLSQTSLNDSKEAVDVRNIIRMISGKKNCEEVINHTAAKSAACEDQRVLLSSSHAALFAAVWLMCLRIYAIKNSGEPTSFDLEAVKYISTTMSFSSVASDFFSRAGPLEETLTSLSALHKPSCWIFIQHMLEMTASVSRQSIQEDTSGAFIDCTPVASLLSTRVFSDARLHQHAEKTMYSLLVTLMAALERISDAEAIAIAKEQTVFDEDMISLEKDKKSQSVLSSHQFNRQIIAKKEEFEEKLQKIKTQYTGVATKIQQKIELYCDELVVILHHLHESDHEEAYLKATKVINTILTISSSNEKQINFIKNKKTSLLASSSILWQKRLELERLQCFRKSSATKWINTPLAQQKYNRLMNLLVVSTEQRCRHNPLLWKMRLEVLIDYNDWTSSNNNISDKNAPSFEALANAALKDCPIFLGNLKEDRVDDGVSLVISTTDSKFRAGDLTNKHVEYLSACVELRITLATIIFQRKSGTAATTMLDDTIARLERLSDGISANMMIETRKTDVSHLTCNVEVLYLRVTGMIASVWNTKAKLLRNHTLGIDVDNQWKDQLINRGEIRVPAMTQEIESCLKLGLKRQSTALCYIEAQLKLRQGLDIPAYIKRNGLEPLAYFCARCIDYEPATTQGSLAMTITAKRRLRCPIVSLAISRMLWNSNNYEAAILEARKAVECSNGKHGDAWVYITRMVRCLQHLSYNADKYEALGFSSRRELAEVVLRALSLIQTTLMCSITESIELNEINRHCDEIEACIIKKVTHINPDHGEIWLYVTEEKGRCDKDGYCTLGPVGTTLGSSEIFKECLNLL